MLGEFDAISVTKDQANRLRWSQVPISTPVGSSCAALRARQAQYPTRLLESNTGFMNLMSAETRSIISATLFVGLGEMKAHMDTLEQIVATEVKRQFELQTLDLRTLYLASACSRKAKKESKDASLLPKANSPKRNLANTLGLDDGAGDSELEQDVDEVF